MHILRVNRGQFVVHQIEEGAVIAYLIDDGRIIDRQVVTRRLIRHTGVDPVAFEALVKALLATVAIMALLLGHAEIARAILNYIGVH